MENSYMLNGKVGDSRALNGAADDSSRLVNEFAQYLISKGKSENTVATYSRNSFLYVKWEEAETGEVFDGQITETSAQNYLKYLENVVDPKGKYLSLSTIKAKMTAVQIFNDYLHGKYDFPRIIVPTKKGIVEPEVEVLTRNEINKLMRYLDKQCNLLQRAVFKVFLNTGIRCSELTSLELSDIEVTSAREKGILTIRSGKGGKFRKIPINKSCISALDSYLAIRPSINDPHVFIGQRGALTRNGVYDMVSSIGLKALNKKVYPHMLRHIFFTTAAKDVVTGGDLKTLSSLAGHGSINTTSKYYVSSSWTEKEKVVSSVSF